MKDLIEKVKKANKYTVKGSEGILVVNTEILMESKGYKRQVEALKRLSLQHEPKYSRNTVLPESKCLVDCHHI